jgi:hypothetical protein
LHATSYQFDTPIANGARSASRALPTFSLDSGLVFERDARFFGRNFVQTLEPRAFYTYTPYRDQTCCRCTTRRPTTSTSPPSTPRTPMARTASPTTTC